MKTEFGEMKLFFSDFGHGQNHQLALWENVL